MNVSIPITVAQGWTSRFQVDSTGYSSFDDNGIKPAYDSRGAELEVVSLSDRGSVEPGSRAESLIKARWEQEGDNSYITAVDVEDTDPVKNLHVGLSNKNGAGVVTVSNPTEQSSQQTIVEIPVATLDESSLGKFASPEQLSRVEIESRGGETSISLFPDGAENPETWLIHEGQLKSPEDLKPQLINILPTWVQNDRQTYLSGGDLGETRTLPADPARVEEFDRTFEMTEMDENPDLDMACGMPGVVAFATGHALHYGTTDGCEWAIVNNGVETPDGWIDNIQLYERDAKGRRSYSFEQQGDRTHTSVVSMAPSGETTVSQRGTSPIVEFYQSMES